VIAPWLYDIAAKYDQEAELIENGFDFDYFKLMKNIEDRSPFIVSMLFNDMEKKGCKYAFQALKTVKNKIPQLKCLIFGVNDRPSYLPDWYEYYKMPDKTTHNMIYNTASIFIAPALIEGHGLTQAEAMQCGCAVIATNIGGYRVNCINNKTALLCEPANSLMMADLIIKLIEDNDLRMTLAKNGYEYIKQFTWERAYKKFKSFIENNS
jgi:glycosyltransferase involved in cell wall biosynthesis